MLASNGTMTISIKPNVDWSIELSNKTDFYIKDGNNDVYTMHGVAGTYTITICAREIVDFDADHTCDVMMKMQEDVKKVASITVKKIDRKLTVYAAKVEEGQFVKNEEGAYVYETTAANNVTLLYDNQEYKYLAPVKVVSNFSFNVVGPEWMSPAKGGDANNEVELVFTADANKLPSDDATADVKFVDANKQDKVGATIKVVMEGSSKFMEYFFGAEEVSFDWDGKLLDMWSMDNTVYGSIKSNADAEVVAVAADGSDASWVTITLSDWDAEGASIQERSVNVGVTENEGEAVRKAYVLALPASMAVENVADLVADGAVKEEYASYLAMTITQRYYIAPGVITASNMVEPAYMAEADATAWPFNESAFSGLNIGSAYELFYVCEWDSSDSNFKTSKDIKAFRSFACTDNGAKEITGENSWIYASEESVKANGWFQITMDPLASTSDMSWNSLTKDLEGVLLIEYTDGSYSAIYCRYNENTTGGSDGVAFENEQYAGWANATLVELHEGDELYDTYFAEYSSTAMPARFYHLTYEFPIEQSMYSMVKLVGIPETVFANPLCDWAYYNTMQQCVVMEVAGAGSETPGVITFMNGMGVNEIVIFCTLNNAE